MKKKNLEWTKADDKAVKDYKKKVEKGDMIFYQFTPGTLMLEFIKKYDTDIKKDKQGNITIHVKRRKQTNRKRL